MVNLDFTDPPAIYGSGADKQSFEYDKSIIAGRHRNDINGHLFQSRANLICAGGMTAELPPQPSR